MSPTARSLKELREQGFIAQVVEHYNSFSRKRNDLFGIFDIVAIRDGETIGIQVTTESNNSARKNKIIDTSSHLRPWLRAGNLCQLWTWQKKNNRWRYRKRSFRFLDEGNAEAVECIDEGWNR